MARHRKPATATSLIGDLAARLTALRQTRIGQGLTYAASLLLPSVDSRTVGVTRQWGNSDAQSFRVDQ